VFSRLSKGCRAASHAARSTQNTTRIPRGARVQPIRKLWEVRARAEAKRPWPLSIRVLPAEAILPRALAVPEATTHSAKRPPMPIRSRTRNAKNRAWEHTAEAAPGWNSVAPSYCDLPSKGHRIAAPASPMHTRRAAQTGAPSTWPAPLRRGNGISSSGIVPRVFGDALPARLLDEKCAAHPAKRARARASSHFDCVRSSARPLKRHVQNQEQRRIDRELGCD